MWKSTERTGTHHSSILQSSVSALNPPCSTYSSCPPTAPSKHYCCYCHHQFAFPECHIVAVSHTQALEIGFFHLLTCVHISSMLLAWPDRSALFGGGVFLFLFWSGKVLALNDISLSGGNGSFIHSPAQGHLSCFPVVAIMSNITLSSHVQVFV